MVITEQASNQSSQGAESAARRIRTLGSSAEIKTMTGRGDGRLFRPSSNPVVTLGLSVTTSSATLDPSSPSPFFLIVTVRILTTPRQDSPITLATHLNPLGGIGNRSFDNIVCIHPKTENAKRIEIGPRGWPHYLWDPDNLRDSWDFVTVPSDGRVEIKHQVDPAKIADAGLKSGEKYQASLTDRCLGTRWWAFGSLEELDGRRFQQWREGAPREGEDGNGRFLVGQRPDDLALVIEKGTTEFEVE